jgi:hypothetical protein
MENELIQQIRDGKVIVTAKSLGRYIDSCAKVKALSQQKMSMADFVAAIKDTDPYKMHLLTENEYIVLSKNEKPAPEFYMNGKQIAEFHKHEDVILQIYPELAEHFSHRPECKSCNDHGKHKFNTLVLIRHLGGVGRDLEQLRSFSTDLFIDAMKLIKPDKTITFDFLMDKIYGRNNQLVRQCMMCTREHIAKAKKWIEQYHKDPVKYWLDTEDAIGDLAHAELECFHLAPELSKLIRIEKHKLEEDEKYIPDWINLQTLAKQLKNT